MHAQRTLNLENDFMTSLKKDARRLISNAEADRDSASQIAVALKRKEGQLGVLSIALVPTLKWNRGWQRVVDIAIESAHDMMD